jgi:hypothetical protein
MREVLFQPSTGRWGLPGYVLVVDQRDVPADFVARVRDSRAVTFLGRSEEWRRFAEELAENYDVPFREFPAETRLGREIAKERSRGSSDRRS